MATKKIVKVSDLKDDEKKTTKKTTTSKSKSKLDLGVIKNIIDENPEAVRKIKEGVTEIITNEAGEIIETTTNSQTTVPTTQSIKVDATYTNVEEMKKAKLSEGKVVLTKGYYKANDGGSAYYNIVKTAKYSVDEGRVIKLNNGLFAILGNSDTTRMSVKQYGVKGDGSSTDVTQINALLNAGYKTMYFPTGTYNMNNYNCKPERYIEIVGDGKQKTIIKNLSVEVKYGIKLENASFEGAPKFDFMTLKEQSILIRLFLKDNTNSVTYNNCSFKDMDIVSALRTDKTYTFKYDHVTNCDFKDIRRAVVYHSANIKESIYTGNTFCISKTFIVPSLPIDNILLLVYLNISRIKSSCALKIFIKLKFFFPILNI